MSTNNKVKFTELDFNNIRENIKEYLRGQDTFSDYDFDGSALSTLIDVLAYNTHYNALYTNMALNEMFLDSASKRNSIVSIANNYGYLPQSGTASRANLTVILTEENPTNSIKVLPAYTPFNTTVGDQSYTFYTLEDYTAPINGNTFTFENVMVYQGELQQMLFSCVEENQKFVLPHYNIDINTIVLTVSDTSEIKEYEKYSLADNFIELTATTKVYFLKELEDRVYQLSFGVNSIGKPIVPGNIVDISYLTTAKDNANGATTFSYGGTTTGGTITTIAIAKSYGGKQEETKEEIRLNVSQMFFDQNRAITASDYLAIVKRYYQDLDSVSVWGGEDNDPPQYGKVFLSIKPASGPYLSDVEKAYIKNSIIKSKGVVSVVPEIIDPTYLEMDVTCNVYFDSRKTSRSSNEIKTAVIQGIEKYNQDYLEKYEGRFRYSKFSGMIDNIDQAIASNITTFTIYSEVIPKYNISAAYQLNLVNPIYNEGVPEEAFSSTGFYIDSGNTVHYLDDDGVGNIRLYKKINETNEKIIIKNVGTINYNLGLVNITGLTITNLLDPQFYFKIKTQSYDVISIRNQIVTIPSNRITVNVIDDKTDAYSIGNTINHKFSSSRS